MITVDQVSTLVKLLRAIATGTDAQDKKHDVVLNSAADALEYLCKERDFRKAQLSATRNLIDEFLKTELNTQGKRISLS